MANDRLMLVWQRIAHAPHQDEILYHEALLRTVENDGTDVAPAEALGALERLGLARSLDQFVVAKVIDELETHPTAVLGVNISAQSAVFDSWWAEAERRLAGNRLIARRLVIEITETAALSSISETICFVDRMRALGCRIALDDFGVGHASIRQLIALKPDIVKVDGFFMRRAAVAERERDCAWPYHRAGQKHCAHRDRGGCGKRGGQRVCGGGWCGLAAGLVLRLSWRGQVASGHRHADRRSPAVPEPGRQGSGRGAGAMTGPGLQYRPGQSSHVVADRHAVVARFLGRRSDLVAVMSVSNGSPPRFDMKLPALLLAMLLSAGLWVGSTGFGGRYEQSRPRYASGWASGRSAARRNWRRVRGGGSRDRAAQRASRVDPDRRARRRGPCPARDRSGRSAP